MKYLLRCLACGCTCWAAGEEDPDTNGFEVHWTDREEWSNLNVKCEHEEVEVIDSEVPEPQEGDAWPWS